MRTPWSNGLPTALTVCGTEYPIRSDYQAALDICTALSDPELDSRDRAAVLLAILYQDALPQGHYEEAIRQGLWFLSGGAEEPAARPSAPRLVDWEQDFPHIVAPLNKVLGQDVRGLDYLHWWTFLAAYQEIGDGTFAQIVRIRDRLARHKALDKQDQEWYRRNRVLVDFKRKYTQQEEESYHLWLR